MKWFTRFQAFGYRPNLFPGELIHIFAF